MVGVPEATDIHGDSPSFSILVKMVQKVLSIGFETEKHSSIGQILKCIVCSSQIARSNTTLIQDYVGTTATSTGPERSDKLTELTSKTHQHNF